MLLALPEQATLQSNKAPMFWKAECPRVQVNNQSLEGLADPCADASLLGLSYPCCKPSRGSSFLSSGQLLSDMWSLLCILLPRMP